MRLRLRRKPDYAVAEIRVPSGDPLRPSRWVALVRHGDEGRVEIDNNAAERTRTAALGREEPAICRIGRQRQAAIYILISSAKT